MLRGHATDEWLGWHDPSLARHTVFSLCFSSSVPVWYIICSILVGWFLICLWILSVSV